MKRLIWLVLAVGVLTGTPAASGTAAGEREVLPAPPCGGEVSSETGALRDPYNDYDGSANHGAGDCEGAPTNCNQ